MARTPPTPSRRDLSTPSQRDLLITPFFSADSWGTLDLATAPGREASLERGRASSSSSTSNLDLAAASDGDCLRQALMLRLLTPLGSLSELGHPDYGSRLHELIGRPSDLAARRLAKAFVLLALRAERRVEAALDVTVDTPQQQDTHTLRIFIRVQPKGGLDALSLGIEVAL